VISARSSNLRPRRGTLALAFAFFVAGLFLAYQSSRGGSARGFGQTGHPQGTGRQSGSDRATALTGGLSGRPTSSQPTSTPTSEGHALPRFVPHNPKVPIPSAAMALRDQQIPLIRSFNAESRNPNWAPVMEKIFEKRFSSEELAKVGLQGVSLSHLECRQSACRLDLSYSTELQRSPPPSDIPLGEYTIADLVAWRTGPLAPQIEAFDPAPAGEGRVRESLIVTFGGAAIDPEKYPAWMARKWAQMKAPPPPETAKAGDK
jgi:hypothetical protein